MSGPGQPTSGAGPGRLGEAVGRVQAGLVERGWKGPDSLFLMATGVASLPDQLRQAREMDLGTLGVPAPWGQSRLYGGSLGGLKAWILEDVAGDPLDLEPQQAWQRGFPVWLAGAMGARFAVHTSAGMGLTDPAGCDGADSLAPGDFAFLRDHINMSGTTPLLGLGASRLGPLFPDVSHLHHLGLRHAALGRAEQLGLGAGEAVGALTPGPALATPAEKRMWASTGAQVAVPSAHWPLLAAAHAGLSVLAVVAVVEGGEDTVELPRLLERAAGMSDPLESLLLSLQADLEGAVRVLTEDESA